MTQRDTDKFKLLLHAVQDYKLVRKYEGPGYGDVLDRLWELVIGTPTDESPLSIFDEQQKEREEIVAKQRLETLVATKGDDQESVPVEQIEEQPEEPQDDRAKFKLLLHTVQDYKKAKKHPSESVLRRLWELAIGTLPDDVSLMEIFYEQQEERKAAVKQKRLETLVAAMGDYRETKPPKLSREEERRQREELAAERKRLEEEDEKKMRIHIAKRLD